MKSIDYFIRKVADWVTRERSLGPTLLRAGLAIAVIAGGFGYALKVQMPLFGGDASVEFDTGGLPGTIALIMFGTGVLMIVVGGVLWFFQDRRLDRKLVLVVEGRGLRDGAASPLSDAVPRQIRGVREPIVLRLRQGDGKILDPEALLSNLNSLPSTLSSRIEAYGNRSDVSLVYGGLTAVPFTFLTGLLIDDECTVITMDWDRQREEWRMLDDGDDGKRFAVSGLDEARGSPDVVLAVSVSYSVVQDDLNTTFRHPVVGMTLEGGNADCHWSAAKQAALAAQLLDTAKRLSSIGTARIHLVLAAQNSVAFRFGRAWDKRNLPDVIVYQYDRMAPVRYPWGVLMPAGTVRQAMIVRPEQKEPALAAS